MSDSSTNYKRFRSVRRTLSGLAGRALGMFTFVGQLVVSQHAQATTAFPVIDGVEVSVSSLTIESAEFHTVRSRNETIGGRTRSYTEALARLPSTEPGELDLVIRVFDGPIDLESWLEFVALERQQSAGTDLDIFLEREVFEESGDAISGKPAQSVYFSPRYVGIAGEVKPAQYAHPVGKEIAIVLADNAIATLVYVDYGAEFLDEFGEAEIDDVAAGIEARQVAAAGDSSRNEIHATTVVRLVNEPLVAAQMQFELPGGWMLRQTETEDVNGKGASARGFVQVELAPQAVPDDRLIALVLTVYGIDPSQHQGETWVSQSNRALLSTMTEMGNENVPDLFLPDGEFAHCMSALVHNNRDSSNGIWRYDYAGQTDDGTSVKASLYGGGGELAACNYLYIAEPDLHEQFARDVARILGTIRLRLAGPWYKKAGLL